MFMSALFDRPLERWGLRGDPHLWKELRAHFVNEPIPETWYTLTQLIEQAILEKIGVDLNAANVPDQVMIERFQIGSGMTDGQVNPQFWKQTAIPILIDRWSALQ